MICCWMAFCCAASSNCARAGGSRRGTAGQLIASRPAAAACLIVAAAVGSPRSLQRKAAHAWAIHLQVVRLHIGLVLVARVVLLAHRRRVVGQERVAVVACSSEQAPGRDVVGTGARRCERSRQRRLLCRPLPCPAFSQPASHSSQQAASKSSGTRRTVVADHPAARSCPLSPRDSCRVTERYNE